MLQGINGCGLAEERNKAFLMQQLAVGLHAGLRKRIDHRVQLIRLARTTAMAGGGGGSRGHQDLRIVHR
jgi:hypothetical protein